MVKTCNADGFDPWVGKIPWRRAWQPTPVVLPGKSHGQRSLAGYSPGVTELDIWKESYDKPRQPVKKQRHQFASKGLYSQSYGFSISHVRMWEVGQKEGWVLKNWCFWTVVLEQTLGSPFDCKEIKGNQLWIFIRRTDAETETPILWPLDAKSWLLGKDPDAGKDWRQQE